MNGLRCLFGVLLSPCSQNLGGKAGSCQFESLSHEKMVSGPLKPFQGKLKNAGVDDAQLLRLPFAPGRTRTFATNQLKALPCTYMSMLESFSQHESSLVTGIFCPAAATSECSLSFICCCYEDSRRIIAPQHQSVQKSYELKQGVRPTSIAVQDIHMRWQ